MGHALRPMVCSHLDDVLEGEQQVRRGRPLQRLAHCQLQERRIHRLQAAMSPLSAWPPGVSATCRRLFGCQKRSVLFHKSGGKTLASSNGHSFTIRTRFATRLMELQQQLTPRAFNPTQPAPRQAPDSWPATDELAPALTSSGGSMQTAPGSCKPELFLPDSGYRLDGCVPVATLLIRSLENDLIVWDCVTTLWHTAKCKADVTLGGVTKRTPIHTSQRPQPPRLHNCICMQCGAGDWHCF